MPSDSYDNEDEDYEEDEDLEEDEDEQDYEEEDYYRLKKQGFRSFYDTFDPFSEEDDPEVLLDELIRAIEEDAEITTSGRKKYPWERVRLRDYLDSRTVDNIINKHDTLGGLPLTLACSKGSASTASEILDCGPDIELADADGTTCFMAAACNAEKYGLEIMNELLDYHEPSDELLNATDKNGNTALIFAADYGRLKIVKLLVSTKRINLDAENKEGESALSYAAKHSTEMVKVLLDAGAIVTGTAGAKALVQSVKAKKPEMTDAMMSSRDDWGHIKGDRDLLIYAAMTVYDGPEVVKRVQEKIQECASSDDSDEDSEYETDEDEDDDDVAYPPVYAALKRKRADDDGDGEDDE